VIRKGYGQLGISFLPVGINEEKIRRYIAHQGAKDASEDASHLFSC